MSPIWLSIEGSDEMEEWSEESVGSDKVEEWSE